MPVLNHRTCLTTALTLVSALTAGPLFAGSAEVAGPDGAKMQFEYADEDLVRIDHGSAQGYMVLRDNKMYSVVNSDGQTIVMDMGEMLRNFGQRGAVQVPDETMGEVLSMQATGTYEEHAGIKGEVYEVRFVDQGGREQSSELVLTKDARAREFLHAIVQMSVTMAAAIGEDETGGREFAQRLDSMNMGVLRFGDDMRVTRLSGEEVAASRFVLPAEPTPAPNLGDIMRSSAASSTSQQSAPAAAGSGGILSGVMGAFGRKPAEEPADGEEEQEPEQKKENPLGKALNSIFGK